MKQAIFAFISKRCAGGTFTVYVDGEDYDDGYVAFPEGYSGYYDFTLPSYGSCGNHNYEIEYVTSDETHASFSVSGSFEVTNYKITGGGDTSFFSCIVPDTVLVGEEGTVWVHLNEECSGELALYVDGNLEDGYVRNRLLPGYYDLYLPFYESCGNHNYEIKYISSDSHPSLSATGSFNVIYNIDVNVTDAYYGAPATIRVNLPSGVKKENVTITVNGNQYTASIKDGLTFSDWKNWRKYHNSNL